MLFLVPLRSASVPSSVHLLAASPCAPLTNNRTSGLYSYQNNTNLTLRKMALRTFFGSCATLTSSVVNLTVLMVLNGEPSWICLMCCNADSSPHLSICPVLPTTDTPLQFSSASSSFTGSRQLTRAAPIATAGPGSPRTSTLLLGATDMMSKLLGAIRTPWLPRW